MKLHEALNLAIIMNEVTEPEYSDGRSTYDDDKDAVLTLNRFASFNIPLKGKTQIVSFKNVEEVKSRLASLTGLKEFYVKFQSLDAFIDKDKKTYEKRLNAILDGSDFKIADKFSERIVKGYVFPTTFVAKVVRK